MYMYMTNKSKDEQAQVRTDLGMNTIRWQRSCVSLRQHNAIANIGIFDKKKKRYSYDPCRNQEYFNICC